MAKKMIISAVSALSAPAWTGRPPAFAVDPTENKMEASKDKAPVLLRIESTGTVDGKAFAVKMSETSEIGVEECALYLNALGETLTEIGARAENVDLGFARAELSISGSLEHGDEPADAEKHQAQYAVIPNEAMKATFAAIECRIPADACPASVKRIRDVATGDNFIHGFDPFYLEGNEMTFGGPGEKLELLAADGKTFVQTLEVLEHDSKIKIKAKLTAPVEAGRYFVALTTLAGGTTTLWPIGCMTTVVYIGPQPIIIKKVTSTATGKTDEWKHFGDDLIIKGIGFDETTKATVKMVMPSGKEENAGNTGENSCVVQEDGTIKYHCVRNYSDEPDATWMDGHPTYVVVTRGDGVEARAQLTVK